MKLVTYHQGQGPILTGVVTGERVLDISGWLTRLPVSSEAQARNTASGITAPDGGIMRLLQSGQPGMEALAAHIEEVKDTQEGRYAMLKDVQLYAPVPRPGKVIGVGRNYADHAKETGVAPFEKPRIIFMVPSSIAAPGAPVTRPATVTKMDFEAELAVVIGGYGKDVPAATALSLVAGYTILNDLSAREFQFDISPPQTTFAKSMDGFTPMGPWLVTRDDIPDPQALEVLCWLNGNPMQHGYTADMLFPVATLIAYISQYMTLEPGDVIATGTPAGIGAFRQPPVYLQPGDRLCFEVTGVGVMEHLIQ